MSDERTIWIKALELGVNFLGAGGTFPEGVQLPTSGSDLDDEDLDSLRISDVKKAANAFMEIIKEVP
jgi:hypothetical protein